MISPTEKRIAECVGLWLAEGDRKTTSEITFTNNCLPLILFFYKTLKKFVENDNFRIYVYSRSKTKIKISIKKIKYYRDKRARKPYLILRIANKNLLEKWKIKTKDILKNKECRVYVLRGIFAGEGNIKVGSHSNRTIRIAQKKQTEEINKILDYLKITYRFFPKERSYVITGRENWEKINKLKICELHPEKRNKFNQVFSTFKQWHYPAYFLYNRTFEILKGPKTSGDLAKIFNRDQTTLQEILNKLKKEDKIKNFRVRSKDYWIRNDSNVILISTKKYRILKLLNNPKRTFEIAKECGVTWKASFRRLNELKKLNLVKNENGLWYTKPTQKEVTTIEDTRDR